MTSLKSILKYIMALLYIIAGANHFINTDFYLKIVPSFLPLHLLLVYVSGFFEILLGLLILPPKFTKYAAWGLIILLIFIFPANINMAINPESYPETSSIVLWLRLPVQFILIGWAYWYTKPIKKKLKL